MSSKDKELLKKRKIAEKAHDDAINEGMRLRDKNIEKSIQKYFVEVKEYSKIFDLYNIERPIRMIARAVELLHRISFKINLNKVKEIELQNFKQALRMNEKASLVSIQPCGEEYNKKTYLGILIGDFALGSSSSINNKTLNIEYSFYNPAIYIPEINKIIFGCESFWRKIKSIEDFKDITKEDIKNVWYLKLLESIDGGNK